MYNLDNFLHESLISIPFFMKPIQHFKRMQVYRGNIFGNIQKLLTNLEIALRYQFFHYNTATFNMFIMTNFIVTKILNLTWI